MTKVNFYYAYGLFIASSIVFPELSSSKSSDYDIIIKFGQKEIFSADHNEKDNFDSEYSKKNFGFLFDNKTLFKVRYGKEILINTDVDINDILLRSLILGQGMGILLYQRGHLVIHGSAINMNGFGAAFIGNCGQGKSTTAIALNSCGYPLLTDDVLLTDIDSNNNVIIIPSFPRVKLWNDVIEKIEDNLDFFTRIEKDYPKYSTIIDSSFDNKPIPLNIIYIIETGETTRLYN